MDGIRRFERPFSASVPLDVECPAATLVRVHNHAHGVKGHVKTTTTTHHHHHTPPPPPPHITTHHSPVTTHHSPLTSHHSPLTTHHTPHTTTTTHTHPLSSPPLPSPSARGNGLECWRVLHERYVKCTSMWLAVIQHTILSQPSSRRPCAVLRWHSRTGVSLSTSGRPWQRRICAVKRQIQTLLQALLQDGNDD